MGKCPRCYGLITHSYASEHPHCALCGWEDYEYSPPKRRPKLDQWGGTQTRLRYVGTYETDILADRRNEPQRQVRDYVVKLTMKSVERRNGVGERLLVRPLCPFCPESPPMEHMSLSNRTRRKLSEERFLCPSNHTIGLVSKTGASGEHGNYIGWN